MGSEKSLWQTFKHNLESDMRMFQRHEDTAGSGIPDVSFQEEGIGSGWIELKHSHNWPKRPSTIVRLEHLTQDQRDWLVSRGNAGGCCKLVWQIGTDYLVFDWTTVDVLGFMNKADTIDASVYFSNGAHYWEHLWGAIIGDLQ